MKKVFELTNRYIIIATPLLLFLLLLCIYFLAVVRNGASVKVFLGLILIFFMASAFCAGWGNMIKSAVEEKCHDAPYDIIKDFIPGVGEYFYTISGAFFIHIIINFSALILAYYAGMHFIGDLGVNSAALSKAMASQEALKTFLLSLSVDQLARLKMWNILLLSVMTGMNFLFMFYYPALYFESKNPFKALWCSLKRTFSRKFPANAGIYVIIFSVNFLISILSAIFAANPVLNFLTSLLNFYFICCVVIGIFRYYNSSFVNSHLGNSIDTYV